MSKHPALPPEYKGFEFDKLEGQKLKVRQPDGTDLEITAKTGCPSLGNAARIVVIDTEGRQHTMVVIDLVAQLEGTRHELTDEDIEGFEHLIQAMEIEMKPSSLGQAKRWAKNPVAKLKDLNAYINRTVKPDGEIEN